MLSDDLFQMSDKQVEEELIRIAGTEALDRAKKRADDGEKKFRGLPEIKYYLMRDSLAYYRQERRYK